MAPKTKVAPRAKTTAMERARYEIFSVLADDLRISTDEIDRILSKYGVKRATKELQRAYRLSVGQRMLAEIRDEEGKREILADRACKATEYIILETCNDPEKLARIRNRLRSQIAGLEQTVEKIEERGGVFTRIFSRWGRNSRRAS